MFENSNRRHFQRGLDCDAARATRRSAQLSLRRKQREAHLQKKVRLSSSRPNNGCDASPMPSNHDLPKFIAQIMNPDNESLNLSGLTAVRRLLSVERAPPSDRVIKSGAISKIIQFLFVNGQYESEIRQKCKFEAAWIVTNIAASTSHCVSCIVQHGAIEGFVNLFRNAHNPETADQAIWGLGNIAGESKLLRDRLLSCGILSDVVTILDESSSTNISMQKNAIWLLSNIFRYGNDSRMVDVKHIVPVITKLLRDSKNEQLIIDALWTLHYLSNQSDEIVEYLCDNGAVNICMKFLHHEYGKYQIALSQFNRKNNNNTYSNNKGLKNNTKEALLKMNSNIYRPALRTIGSMLASEDRLTQMVLDAGYLDVIEPFTYHFTSQIRRESFWSLSNILAGSHQQIEAVLSRRRLVESIVNATSADTSSVRKEACWCICNTTNGISEQKKRFAECGAIEALCGMLAPANIMNEQHLRVIVEGLEGFLAVYGERGSMNPIAEMIEEHRGLDYLEERMGDTNIAEDTFNIMADLVHRYWGTVEENSYCVDEQSGTIDTKTGQFKFGIGTKLCQDENNPNVANGNNRFQF